VAAVRLLCSYFF